MRSLWLCEEKADPLGRHVSIVSRQTEKDKI